jgi:exodeoxyribonuclease V alpha subunit
MTHSQGTKNKHGKYFPYLEPRLERYCERLSPGSSFVFFYLNYDNPVSAHEYKYALVGCARLSSLGLTGHFPFEKRELDRIRSGGAMKNFPTLNWAIRITHGPEGAVRLPYQEYLAHVAQHPKDEPKLQAMRLLIDEPALAADFKYVSEQIDDDHCLALLYKLKRAFALVEEQGIADPGDSFTNLDKYIEEVWRHRGLYPGLAPVLSVLANLADGVPQKEGDPQKESDSAWALVDALRGQISESDDLLEAAFTLLGGKSAAVGEMQKHTKVLRDARAGLRDQRELVPLLRKLSLFSLTPRR